MDLSGASDSRKRSWATTAAERVSLTSPFKQIIRSCDVTVSWILGSVDGGIYLKELGEDIGLVRCLVLCN